MKTTQIGQQAESLAIVWLEKKGYRCIAQNWRTKYCEIDCIVENKNEIVFVEVKYRKSNEYGDGSSAVGYAKLRQMEFAAEFWLTQHDTHKDTRLAVISMSSHPPQVDAFYFCDER